MYPRMNNYIHLIAYHKCLTEFPLEVLMQVKYNNHFPFLVVLVLNLEINFYVLKISLAKCLHYYY